jgi:hypothetical protein
MRTYDELLSVDLFTAMKLGVEGFNTQANRDRHAVAVVMMKEYDRRSELAFERAAGHLEPLVLRPLGLEVVLAAEGDLSVVVADPNFVGVVEQYLGLESSEVFVSDEDGERYEWHDGCKGEPENVMAVQELIARISNTVTSPSSQPCQGRRPDVSYESSNDGSSSKMGHQVRSWMDEHRGPWGGRGRASDTGPFLRTVSQNRIEPPSMS